MAEPTESTRALRVTGRVQGVGYRAWAAETARRRGLRGWVRNTDDGAVEIRLAGAAAALAAMREDLRRGPPAASVAAVEEIEGAPAPRDGFEIRS